MNNSNLSLVTMEKRVPLSIFLCEALSATDIMFTSLEGTTALDKWKYDFSQEIAVLCDKTASIFCFDSCLKYRGFLQSG